MKMIVCVLMLLLLSCSPKEAVNNGTSRIKFKATATFGCDYSYQIIEVDGVEYISAYKGGMCPLVRSNKIEN